MPSISARFALPGDAPFQWGLRIAAVSPFLSFGVGAAALSVVDAHWEYGLSWSILHIVAFSLVELAWIVPVSILCAVLGRRRFAAGLAVGALFLVVANALAWAAGLMIGAA